MYPRLSDSVGQARRHCHLQGGHSDVDTGEELKRLRTADLATYETPWLRSADAAMCASRDLAIGSP